MFVVIWIVAILIVIFIGYQLILKYRKANQVDYHGVNSNILYTEQVIAILNRDYHKSCIIKVRRKRSSSTKNENIQDTQYSLDDFITTLKKENIEYLKVKKNNKHQFFAKVPSYCQRDEPGEITEFYIENRS